MITPDSVVIFRFWFFKRLLHFFNDIIRITINTGGIVMLLFFFLNNKYLWILAWALQSFGYYFMLNKAGDNPAYAIVPFIAEWRLSKYVYCRKLSFNRAIIITLIFVLAGLYMNPLRGMGRLMVYVGAIVYFFFLMRLYRRLLKAMRKTRWLYIVMFLFPPLFLYLLAKGDDLFIGPTFKVRNLLGRIASVLRYAIIVLICAAEIVAITLGVSLITIRRQQPRFLANYLLKGVEDRTKDIVGDNNAMSREEALDANVSLIENAEHSREYFFPDHSQDGNVVVMSYIIGSDLENAGGYATANIKQMIDASSKGDKLSFVMQAGGSFRWFMNGIQENSNGRYLIENGKFTKIEDLDPKLCMSEAKSLEDFIAWTKRNYPADRYILVLWDHGGGFSNGYGVDELNRKKDHRTMLVNEMISALQNAGVRFDIIGFDACLMQTLETAVAFEPYADYFIASEESEGGYGWFYTSAFGKLAKDPTVPSLDFAQELISAYDLYNTAIKEGKIDSSATLSVVDLTMIRPIYENLNKLFSDSNEAILENPEYYADISISASKAYGFSNYESIDLIHYLKILDELDYDNRICKDNACQVAIDSIKAAIPYRNRNSAEGVNGLALSFPVRSASIYSDIYKQFIEFAMNDQKAFYNNFFSIMVAQQKDDYLTNEEWYIKGFEQYDTTSVFIDIPLVETDDGYRADLPEKVEKMIVDTQVAVYQKDHDMLRYLGNDYVADTEGNQTIYMDDSWVHINNNLICYETTQPRKTDEGTVYTGIARARLNGNDDIIINIEWEPVTTKSLNSYKASITGYTYADEFKAFMSKGLKQFQSGDRLDFYFDYYDMQGNFLKKETYGGTLLIANPDYLTVSARELKNCDIVFNGVLTDVYQRQFLTEQIEYHID